MHLVNTKMGLVGYLLPDMYLAESVADINHDIGSIRKPSKWSLRNNLWGIGYPGEVLIVLYSVNVEPKDADNYLIFDSTSTLLVSRGEGIDRMHPDSIPFEDISSCISKYSEVYLLHQPHGSLTSLYGAMRHTQAESTHSKLLHIGERRILIPRLAF